MRVVPDYLRLGLGLQSWIASGRHLRIAIRLGLGQRDQRSKVLRGKGGIADQQTRHRRDHADRREVRHRIEWQPRIEGRVDLMAGALIGRSERDAPC